MLCKRQSRKIFVVNNPTMFRKVQSTGILFVEYVGTLHLNGMAN